MLLFPHRDAFGATEGRNIRYVTISINDNGKGFDKRKMLKESNGLGITGMIERAKLRGGSLRIKSIRNEGTTILAKLPF